MPTISTLGGPAKRRTFAYDGTVNDGVVVHHKAPFRISPKLFAGIINAFDGKTVAAGVGMTNPAKGGLGLWVEANSKELNGRKLTPRHVSFIAAILVHEGKARHSLRGNAIYLHL